MKPYIALIKIELKLALRQRTIIFFNYVFPLFFFFIFAQVNHAEQGGAITQIVAMVSTIGIIGNGLFGAGMRAAQERENNTLRRYKVTPIGPLPLLVSSMATGLILYLPYIAIMLTLASQIYHMPVPKELPSMLIFISIGVIAFRAIGLIVASVVNSVQEGVILVQLLYFAMLFLSGSTFPLTQMPKWLQDVTQFIPATYLVSGLEGILLRNENLLQNVSALGALLVTVILATFVSTKIFRWEKEEKIKPSAKLWVVAVLVPFFILGGLQAVTHDNVEKSKVTERESRRGRTRLLRNARIFTGDGRVIESGSLLIKNGKIEEIYEGAAPDAKALNADPIEASGKTILPGLIDMHVHLTAPGGIADNNFNPNTQKYFLGALAAYLHSGITAIKSVGDPLDRTLEARELVNSGRRLGSQFFICGPLFTTEGGHGTEYFKYVPAQYRDKALNQFVRTPKTPEEARKMVDELKAQKIDGIKAVLESGVAGANFNRLDTNILNAIVDQARKQGMPVTVHTGNAQDVADALKAGTNGIEHGSLRDKIPDQLFVQMAKQSVYYDPTLSVAEGFRDLRSGNTFLLNRSLVQQVGPKDLLASTLKYMQSVKKGVFDFPIELDIAKDNLLRAWKAGVTLVTGSDAGNPLVFHGPTTQREVQLWIEAGIPAPVALQAATANSAKFLGAQDRFGTIRKGLDATLLVVDGNPLQDPKALEVISNVFLKGERVDRSSLFDQN
jgi:imidazolonepropionase-like amidohydrolase/ABC-type multidrug transport system permease subunit